ncbi:MAG: hypothetical protein KF851_17310 [Pirellulaceae bacterium]|jgi:hypothetical protein|nr:hypothetical protein [Pirellulaceae bacterium]
MSQAGKTSQEIVIQDGKIVRPKPWVGFNFYHALLTLSAFFLTVATLLMYLELSKWGSIFDLPWKTTEAQTELVSEE